MLRVFGSCRIKPVCRVLAASVVLLAVCRVEAETLVVPSGLENVEGDGYFAGQSFAAPGVRFQEVFSASEFALMESSPGAIVQMAFRPDESVDAPRTTIWRTFELKLSTTDREAGTLSPWFDENHGTDITLVYSGDLTMSTQGTGSSGGPCSFDYVIEFDAPFLYDPSVGNLLIDWRAWSVEGSPMIDGYDDGEARILTAEHLVAPYATGLIEAGSVVEFVIVPEPTAALLCSLGLMCLIGSRRKIG
jgi:hypothetical protein